MITADEMFEPMLAALPGFRPEWEEFVAEWSEDPEGLPHYLALSSLARYLISLLERKDERGLTDAFGVVEIWHVEGDKYVREAATVGLLEDLQNLNLHTTTDAEDFRRFLGPESEIWWDKAERFWSEGRVMTDDRND